MTTTLSEGVKVPDVGSVNWAGDLEINWNLLNGALANLSGNVKLDRDNTWTGEQSFTLPIVGSLTGTASKAIADEDGTSIKTGYVNVAGNQTVSGQKTWTATQTVKGAPPALNLQSTNIQRGVAPASNSNLNLYGKDLNGAELCRLIYRAAPTGERRLWLGVNDDYSNGALSPTGTSTWNSLNLYLRADGKAETTFSADLLPATNNAYNLGSLSYQWSSVYAQTYYYNGTAWGPDKANEWTENNIFSKQSDPASVASIADTTLAFNGLFNTIFLNTRGSSNRRSYGSFLFAGYGSASGADNYGQIQLLRSTDKRGDTNEGYIPDTSFKLLRVNPHSLLIDFMENVRVVNDGTYNTLCPITTDATDLGTSTNKWKTLNGINPGALSLPTSSYVEIDTTNWNLTGADNSYIPPEDGYLICTSNTCTDVKVYDFTTRLGATSHSSTSNANYVYLPVRKNDNCIVGFVGTSPVARFYPAQGNV